MKKSSWKQVAVAAGLCSLTTVANASFIATIPGNDCAGEFGGSFNDCKISASFDPNQSPVIIKFDVNGSGNAFLAPEINTNLFPSIDGSEFSFTGTGSTGTWTYTAGPQDPIITFFVAKGGNFFNLFDNPAPLNTDTWSTPLNPNNQRPFGLSHLTFYDSGSTPPQEIPEPGILALVGLGLLGIGAARRRKK